MFANNFLSKRIIYPAKKPARIPPRKPETVAPPVGDWNANLAINP